MKRLAMLPPMLLVALLAFALVMPFQGTRHLWGTDEGRYSAVAVEMIDSGDWLVPRRNPEHVHLSKPPLTYWAMAASMEVFGRNTWALRLPAALAFVLLVVSAFSIGKRLVPGRPWWPSIVCAGTAMLFLASNAISTDPLLSAFETLGMAGFVLAWRGESDRIARRGALILGFGFALAFLTKGPPGLIPLVPALWFWARNRKEFRANPFTWRTLAVWAPIALSWFVAVVWLEPARLGYFLGYETYGRIFTDAADRHPQWYGWIVAYGPVALVGALPWTLVVAWDALRRRANPPPADGPDERAASRFLLLWLLVPLAVFCFARSRLILYVMPLLVPFALWVALRTRRIAVTTTGKVLLAAWFALLLAAKVYLPIAAAKEVAGKDTRLLSDALLAQVHAPISEVVFVDETALYGIRVYLDLPVLRVGYGDSSNPAVDASLAEALAQHRAGRLYVVNVKTADVFEREVGHTGAGVRHVLSYGHYRGYFIDQPAAPGAPAAQPALIPMGQDTPVPPSPQ